MGVRKRVGAGQIGQRTGHLYDRLVQDLGGEQAVSEAEKQLARRASALSAICDQLEPAATAGIDDALNAYLRATETLRRVLSTLGPEKRSTENAVGLSKYLATRYADREEA